MKSHEKEKYEKMTHDAMERNPKSKELTEEQKKVLEERNARISEWLHAQMQMMRTAQQFHKDVYGQMVDLYNEVGLDRDANLRKWRQYCHDAEVKMASMDNLSDEMYKFYTKKLFPDTNGVAIDDTQCYSVLYDIITTAFGCTADGHTLNNEWEVVRVRRSYLNSVLVADPRAKDNFEITQ